MVVTASVADGGVGALEQGQCCSRFASGLSVEGGMVKQPPGFVENVIERAIWACGCEDVRQQLLPYRPGFWVIPHIFGQCGFDELDGGGRPTTGAGPAVVCAKTEEQGRYPVQLDAVR
jgi:hypothetical protein